MSKVTLVEPQKKNSRRFNVFLDGQFAFGADEDTVVNFRLVPGKEIPSQDLEKILFETEVGKLMDRVYGLLSVRMRSEKEIRDYLRNLSFKRKIKDKEELSEVVIESLIEKLKQKGLINDSEFAKAWIESRRKTKYKGIQALKGELFQKGISKEVMEQVFEEESIVSEADIAFIALQKKLKVWGNLTEAEFNQKAGGYLGRKGFSYDVVKEVLDRLKKNGLD